MRVLHVAESTAGGLGTYLFAVTAAAAERGWDAHAAVPTSAEATARFAATGCQLHTWDVRARPGLHLAREIRTLSRIVSAADPDVVHLHSSMAGLAGRLLLRGRRPTVTQPHSWSFIAVNGAWSTGARQWERVASRWVDAIVCVSDAERRIAAAAGIRAPLVVIPNGVDLCRFSVADSASRIAARQRVGVGPEPLAVCVGRLHRQKNQGALLDVWPAVRAAVPDAQLAVIGDGPDRNQLLARRVPGVTLTGAVDDPRDWYAAADVVVQPSRWEGMSLAVLEALATGRCVVATEVPGMTEIVEPAALVPPGDDRALAAAVVARLDDPGTAAAEGLRGRARVEESHDLRSHLRRVLALEMEVAEGRRPTS